MGQPDSTTSLGGGVSSRRAGRGIARIGWSKRCQGAASTAKAPFGLVRSRDRAIRPAVVVSLRERRPERSLRSRPPFAHRSSNRRSAIYRRSRTVCSLARSDPIKELGLAGQGPGKGNEGADAGPRAAGADVAIGGAIVEGRSRDVDMCPWGAVRHKFPQKGGGQ